MLTGALHPRPRHENFMAHALGFRRDYDSCHQQLKAFSAALSQIQVSTWYLPRRLLAKRQSDEGFSPEAL
jgi:hypothetical protein